ncbi:MAG: hypothetical protein A2534_00260 [Candidatus Magasanikbacteria bacterium RIFOXYD2_FULL_39_9]|uniref:Uncharacterized protein n=1 Tax=Candidatus Magasanikbacteria bacterium RIFOXYD1_FULL_40_23 TaxID=1798705 RepID=A0A1F6P9B6_9BACT|nr:MAG: hypothetical protein A2534_00260 [Candidatus Magasanikbacteria bacterium RIFOXYD2_FULL_39_9]OGH92762.1 MAG: hypothetical protein A2563_03785 [Candidatus Magasanikbacteria bacterium RIFOXYD1_FULL_40_23]
MPKFSNLFEETVYLAVKDSRLVTPSATLADRVLFAIERKKRFYASVKLAIYSLVTITSSIGLAVVWRIEGSAIINSEAIQLLSLLFSDFSIVASYWQDYAFSLLESLPVVSIIVVASFAWAACASLWMAARTYKTFNHRAVVRV